MSLLLGLLYIPAAGIAAHFIGEVLPRSWFDADRFPFRCQTWEQNGRIYEKIGVRKWKDRLPDKSKMAKHMVRKSVSLTGGADQVERLVQETCVAEIVHWVLMLLSWIIRLLCGSWYGTVIAVLYALSHVPYIIIQRYNRPKLQMLAQRLKQREERIRNESTDSVCQHG